MQSERLPALDRSIWMSNDDFHPAVCPICRKVISCECSLVPCEHALSLFLDIAGETDRHPAWGYEGFDIGKADHERDRLLVEEEWTLVRINQSDCPGPHGATWTVELAWPTRLLDAERPEATILSAIYDAVDHFQELMGEGLDPYDIPPEHMAGG
jgi:hypothetical protein